jgi:hypothetical protein
MSSKFNDFKSRQEFIRSLNHWHYDAFRKPEQEFIKIAQVDDDYSESLNEIHSQLDQIKQKWNDQSMTRIREEIVKTNNNLNLAVLAGQEHDKLSAGYDPEKSMYHTSLVKPDSIWKKIGDKFGLQNSLIRLHVQFPGDVTVWHTDIFAPYHDLLPDLSIVSDEKIGHDCGLRRVLIALEDWSWGQCFMFGAQTWSQWQAGDVIYWPFGTPHCSSNMGYDVRISLSVTGLKTPEFQQYIGDLA